MSSTTISKNLFDNFELVSTTDVGEDNDNLVYMDSDSENSDVQAIASQEVVSMEKDVDVSMEIPDNPMEFTIKKEEEVIVEDVPIVLSDGDEFEVSTIMEDIQESSDITQIHSPVKPDEDDYKKADLSSFDFDTEVIIAINPPANMPDPNDFNSEFTPFEEQFELIDDAIDTNKTDEDNTSRDTSLVDHQYSQPETKNKEFCDDLVQSMLHDTGNKGNSAALQLLSKFTEIFEHFVAEDPDSQMSLYLRSMKATLSDRINQDKQQQPLKPPTPPPLPPQLLNNDTEKATELEPRLSICYAVDSDTNTDAKEDIILPEWSNDIVLPPTQESEAETSQLVDEVVEGEKKPLQFVDKLKSDIKSVQMFGDKLVSEASTLLNVSIEDEEDAAGVKTQLYMLLKTSRKEYRNLIKTIKGEANIKQEDDINEKSKKSLINEDSTDYMSTSDSEDLDQAINLNRKILKTGPETPAIVSSTKEDSDVPEVEAEKAEEPSQSSSSESEVEIDIDKQIEKLLDFSSITCPKPAPSRTTSKRKKIKKKKKKRTTDIESLLGSSSEDESMSKSYSSCDDERETSDEENQMLKRQNADIKQLLLADSDSSNDGDESTGNSDSAEFGNSSGDESIVMETSKKEARAVTPPTEVNQTDNQEEKKESQDLGNDPLAPQIVQQAPVDYSKNQNKIEKETDSEGEIEKGVAKKKRNKRDSSEREIFSKGLLEPIGTIKKALVSNATTLKSENSVKQEFGSPTKSGKSETAPGTIDVSMFENKKSLREIDLQKLFEKRANVNDGVASTSSVIQTTPSKLPPAVSHEDEWISLSSDSDSEVSVQPSGSSARIPKRKKMLTEEELQEETKRAQKEETQRVERLKKKDRVLTQMMTQLSSQESNSQDELILDYDSRKKITIKVHEKLVKHLKAHQKEGIKFMYDTCFGSIADEVETKSGCILAHCMGLGKTLQLITLLHTLITNPQTLKTSRVLIICPKSTIMNWYEEFKHWLKDIDARGLKISYLDDQKFPDRVQILKQWHNSTKPGVFLINYEAFRYMVHYSGSPRSKIPMPEHEVKRLQEIINQCLLDPGPDLVVCDEGHLIKNQNGATNKAITKILTRRRIILTGTPVQNNLNEYYAMVDWIKPALLGTVREFNNLYANPIKDGQHQDSTPQMIKRMKQRSFILNKKLSKFVQRKEAKVLEEFLPEKHEYVISTPLTQVQEDLYEHYLFKNPVDGGRALLNDYTALRKIWTHPKVLQNARERAIKGELKIGEPRKHSKNQLDEIDDEPDDLLDKIEGNTGVKSDWWKKFVKDDHLESLFTSNKLILLFEILRLSQERGEKVLIFSGFVAVLNVVENFMKKIHETYLNPLDPNGQKYGYQYFRTTWKEGEDYYRLDGSTKREVRHQMIQKFNDKANKKLRCFLISARAGGQGINLTGANRCIILDTSWNPSSDQQNIFRIYRLGQPKACYVYRLIALGTMEEKIYSRSVTKQAMSGRVVDKLQIDRHYRLDELSMLYTLTKFDITKKQQPNMPTDPILKHLLHHHPSRAFSYHEHDSLLENKPSEDLNDDEIQEAWQIYEAESNGPVARVGLNGNLPPLNVNDLMRTEMLGMNYIASAAALDPSGLLKHMYQQPPNFFSSEYLQNMLPFDFTAPFRNTSVPTSTNSITSNIPALSSPSSLLRPQLTANVPFAPPSMSSSLFNFTSASSSNNSKVPSISPVAQKRRQSTSRKSPSSPNVQNLMSLQQRLNGNISRYVEENTTRKNNSANLAILPDNPTTIRKQTTQIKRPPSSNTSPSINAVPNITKPKTVQVTGNMSKTTPVRIAHQQLQQQRPMTSLPSQSARTSMVVKNFKSTNLPTAAKPLTSPFEPARRLVPVKSGVIQNLNGSQAVPRQALTKAMQQNLPQKLVNNPKVTVTPQVKKTLTVSKPAMLTTKPPIPQNFNPAKSGETIHKNAKQIVQQFVNQKSGPISITKLTSPISSNQLGRQQFPTPPSTISMHKLQPTASRNVYQPRSIVLPSLAKAGQKRPLEESKILETQKRVRLDKPIKVQTREERERSMRNMPSQVEDIVEIE